MRWNSKNKKHFVSLGYEFTKIGDPFMVAPEDLSNGSEVKVHVKCDSCGKNLMVRWRIYKNITGKTHGKYLCSECGYGNPEHIKKVLLSKYGVPNVRSIPGVNEKIEETCLGKYGCKNPFQSELIKEKMRKTCLERYGVEYYTQTEESKQRRIETSIAKYGVDHYMKATQFRERSRGENNPHWRGGVENHPERARATGEYQLWRKSVFDRDRYTCQCCGKRSGQGEAVELHAHHVYNWADYIDKRYLVENGITLCVECHYEFHSLFGKKCNTPEQLEKFLELKRYAELAEMQQQELQDKKLAG